MKSCNNQYDASSSDIIITNIISVNHDIRTSKWSHARTPRENTTYALHYTLNGETLTTENNETFIIKPGNLTFLTSNTDTKNESLVLPTEFISVYFKAELSEKSEKNLFSRSFRISNCSIVKKAFLNIKNIFYSKQVNYQLKIKKELYNIFSIITDELNNITLKNSNYYVIKAADTYIKETYMRSDLTIEQLADICKITPAYFCRVFKEVYGISPKKYIINLKMETAEKYLLNTSTPITEIAKMLGYNDLSYFINTFKTHFDKTPSQYRNK